MVTLNDILASEWGLQARQFMGMGVPSNQIIQLFGPQLEFNIERGVREAAPVSLSEDPRLPQQSMDITGAITDYVPVSEVPVIMTGQSEYVEVVRGSMALVTIGTGVLSILNSITSYGALSQLWPLIVGILKGYGILATIDEVWESITGTEGLRLPLEVDDALKAILGDERGYVTDRDSGTGKLHKAPGWKEKTCTKYVRRQAKQYQAMYKPMKTFTNAEKNGYSMGHRVASVWWSKALRRAKRRSYRAGRRKGQQEMMMWGKGGMNPAIMIDT